MSDMTTEEALSVLEQEALHNYATGEAKCAIETLRNRLAGQLGALKAIHEACTTGEDATDIILGCADIARPWVL